MIVDPSTKIYESLALRGDISGLSPQEKTHYYAALCERLGLDPYTQPFTPLKLNGREILYASRAATDQLARIHNVTRRVMSRERIEDVYVVTVQASLPNGRTEDAIGAVPLSNLKGESLANALMKSETKAKRRATLAILGLGMLDESELETLPKSSISPSEPTPPTPSTPPAVQTKSDPSQPATVASEVIAMIRLMQEQGLTDRELMLAICSNMVGREIHSRKDLTPDEANRIRLRLQAVGEAMPEGVSLNEFWQDYLVGNLSGDLTDIPALVQDYLNLIALGGQHVQ
jgi:hypothetical protein